MGVTTNANNMSLVHASSSGISTAFPDVCKTPTPAGPIPIPYPNIAQSSDTADGASTVKVDGNPVMLKGSNYKMSSGDEAGSAQGVASNKIKGKAEAVNYSMDVKADGDNLYRLGDPMKANEGGSANGMSPLTVEGPVFGMPATSEACKKSKDKKKEQSGKGTQWGQCGIIGKHRGGIQSAATQKKVVIYFRQTKGICGKWIGMGHQPKPHSCMSGTTIKASQLKAVSDWLHDHFVKLDKAQKGNAISAPPASGNQFYSRNARDYVGIIGQPRGSGIQPLRSNDSPVQDAASYRGKWMTGDYDLFQVLASGPGCKKVAQEGDDFKSLQKLINSNIGWDGVQHGPQAQWVPNAHEVAQGVPEMDMNKLVKNSLTDPNALNAEWQLSWERPDGRPILDHPLTVVAGEGVVTLDDAQAVKDALICQECDQ